MTWKVLGTNEEGFVPARVVDYIAESDRLKNTFVDVERANEVGGLFDFFDLPSAAFGVTAVNASIFGQDNITRAPNGDQYVAYWDARRRPIVARLAVGQRTWTTFDLGDLIGNPLAAPVPDDGHNSAVIAVDGLGFVHYLANHHNSPLRYVRSTAPNDISSWKTITSMVGTQEAVLTYPIAPRMPNGDLLIFYRDGFSGDGDWYINRYVPATGVYTRVGQLFKGTAPVSPSECAYPNRIVVGADGRIHIFYLWRENDSETSNHDISYVVSTDGVNWKTADGVEMTLPIRPSDKASVIRAGYANGLLNQTGASVDANGVPHAAWWLTPTPGSAELHHFSYSEGEWHDDIAITLPVAATRPAVFSYQEKTWAIYSKNGFATSLRLAPTVGEEVRLFPVNVNQWECGYDATGNGRLRTLVMPGGTRLESVWGGLLSLDASVLDGYPAGSVLPRPAVASAPSKAAPAGGAPMTPGYYFTAPGQKDATRVTVARGNIRAGILTPARDCEVAHATVRLAIAGGTGSTYKIAVYDAFSRTLIASSAEQSGTVTGVITIPMRFRLLGGRAVYVGVVAQGADVAPQFGRLTGLNNPFAGALTANQATDDVNNYVGIEASVGDGPLPATIGPNLTGSVPLVGLYVPA
ncbi:MULTISPECIES: BNR repeat-containing protein [unclassified Microbacterium]|uniref:BNR repeat-containing protein n=1 Tax=unclassified Microbacterium TaxID=2609290 RepID=UPI00386E6151